MWASGFWSTGFWNNSFWNDTSPPIVIEIPTEIVAEAGPNRHLYSRQIADNKFVAISNKLPVNILPSNTYKYSIENVTKRATIIASTQNRVSVIADIKRTNVVATQHVKVQVDTDNSKNFELVD